MSVSMMSSQQMALRQPAGAARRTPSRRVAIAARASRDRQQSEHLTFPQVAIRTMIAATAAAGLVLAPAPATAGDVFTYGRSEVIAAKEKLFEEAQAKAVAAMEELAAARAKVSSTVKDSVAQVTPAPTRTEIGPPAAGSVKSSGVPSAVSAPADLPSPGSAISAAASSLSNLVQSVTGQQ